MLPEPVLNANTRAPECDWAHHLSRSDVTLAGIEPVMSHLLATSDRSFFSEEIVARVRGMLVDLAEQLVRPLAPTSGKEDAQAVRDALVDRLASSKALLSHCHALAVEWQLTARLEAQSGYDPVLSPRLQKLVASSEQSIASLGMETVAAQSRFVQHLTRMKLTLGDLSGELFYEALECFADFGRETQHFQAERMIGELRSNYDESASRLSVLTRAYEAVEGEDRSEEFSIAQWGVALFLTALAERSGQPRDLVVLAGNESQLVRLALTLRAAGLSSDAVDAVMMELYREPVSLGDLHRLASTEAQSLLREANRQLVRAQ